MTNKSMTVKPLLVISSATMVMLFFLFLLPLLSTLSEAFYVQGEFSVAAFLQTVFNPYILRILLFTVVQAAVSTLASILLGLPGAWLMANYDFKGKKIISAIGTVPFVLPSILVVLGFVIFYGNNGFLNRVLMSLFGIDNPPVKLLYSFQAIILAHAFYNFPVIMSVVSSYWQRLDRNPEQVALTLGAHPRRVFFSVTLPRILPAVISAASLVFLFCFTSFAIILVLGGGPRFTTMEVEIYRRARLTMDLQGAASLSILSIVLAVLLLLWYSHTQKKLTAANQEGSWIKRKITGWGKAGVTGYGVLICFLVLAPLLSIVIRSFLAPTTRTGGTVFSLNAYAQLFSSGASGHMASALSAIITSFAIGIIVVLVTIPLTLGLSYRIVRSKRLAPELFGMLPLAVSSVVIGLGYFTIASKIGGASIGSVLLVLAHVVIALPFMIRTVLPRYRSIPEQLTQAALTLGATPLQAFSTITLPLLKSALVTGSMFAFAISLGEINATLTLADARITTIPLVMYRLVNAYNYQGACALGTVLMVVCAAVFFISESLRESHE